MPADTGTTADVRDARRALLAVFEPRWVRGVVCLVGPALLAVVAGPAMPAALTAGAAVLAGQGALLWWQYRRPVRPQPVRLWSTRVYLVWGVLIAAFLAVLAVVRALVAYPQAAAVTVVAGAVLLTAGYAFAWNSDPLGSAGAPHRPAALDPVIAPRPALMACTVLAAVDQIDARLLARVLGLSEDGLAVQTGALVGAQYVAVAPEGPRRWFGLTAAGLAAYRGHLQALLQSGRGSRAPTR